MDGGCRVPNLEIVHPRGGYSDQVFHNRRHGDPCHTNGNRLGPDAPGDTRVYFDAKCRRDPIGKLEFKDGVPTRETAAKLYDNLDFTYAYRAFMDNMRGVSIRALRKGLQSIGVKENEVLVFSDLMDAKSLFLTANADTIYVMGYLDLAKGPVVLETPPDFLGAVQDAWFRWVVDVGAPGPDRGQGGSDRAA